MPTDKVNFDSLCHILAQKYKSRDEDIRIMGQRGEFRGEYRIGVTAGELKDKRRSAGELKGNEC